MSPDTNQNPEAELKKPSITESVEDLISKKKAERESLATTEVSEKAAGVQTEVTEVMAGMEKPKEKVSERKGESGERGDIKGGGAVISDDDSLAVKAGIASFVFPVEEVMVKKIRAIINVEIRMEMKKAKKLRKNLITGGAQEYNATIARIRKLKEMLASLFTATFEFIKRLYQKYFTHGGKKRSMDEIEV